MAKLPDIELLIDECSFEATRSSGKGGQNVNKVSTKMILLFDIAASAVLDEDQKVVFQSELHTRVSKAGIFRISSGRERTQLANKKLVIARFAKLVEMAFKTEEERIATKPTKGSKLRRIENKKEQSLKKANRSSNWGENEES
jgi:ribosome-associated protein